MSEHPDPTTLVEPAATRVRDPLSNSSVWLAGMVRNVRVESDKLRFDLVFQSGHSRDDRKAIEAAIIANLRGLGYDGDVLPFPRLEGSAGDKPKPSLPGMDMKGVTPHGGAIAKMKLPGVKHIIAVASGKGGVGKSTVSTNLAVALMREGYQIGLVDLDIYGPSLPRMMNISQRPMVDDQKKIIPVNSYGIRCLSTGLLVPEDEAMIWRGPMIMGIIRQFLQDVRWEGLDVLVVDLPPGTGDAQLSLFQAVELSGGIVVTTPQEVALADAIRGITMFRKLEVPFLGIVENMAYYELPDGTKDFIFGEGGGLRTAQRFDTELLAQFPLRTALRKACDQGLPAALGDDNTAHLFRALARRVAQKLGLGAP